MELLQIEKALCLAGSAVERIRLQLPVASLGRVVHVSTAAGSFPADNEAGDLLHLGQAWEGAALALLAARGDRMMEYLF